MIKKNKNIAFLGHGIYYGGATTSLYLLIKSLSEKDYNIFLYVPNIRSESMKNDFARYCQQIRLIPVNQIRNAATCSTSIKKFEQIQQDDISLLIDHLKGDGIDILHINTTVFSHVYEEIKRKTSVKIVTHVREMLPKYDDGIVQHFVIDKIFKHSNALICISDNEQTYFQDHPNCHVIANPFNFNKTKINSSFRTQHNITNDTVLVGMLGQFEPAKGQDIFLEMAESIITNEDYQKKVKFALIGIKSFTPIWKVILKKILGRNDYSYKVKRLINRRALRKNVIVIPYSYEILSIIKGLDIVVRPARTCDPWGRDIIESMAFAKPIVATGTSDFFVKNNETGYLIRDVEPSALAVRVIELISNEILRKKLGKNAQKHVKSLCNFEKYSNLIENIYRNL